MDLYDRLQLSYREIIKTHPHLTWRHFNGCNQCDKIFTKEEINDSRDSGVHYGYPKCCMEFFSKYHDFLFLIQSLNQFSKVLPPKNL